MEDNMRIPPHSVEAEQSVLGSILLDKEAMISVSETLVPEDFYKEAHKVIYESMLKLYNSQSEIDLITIASQRALCFLTSPFGKKSFILSSISNTLQYCSI